MLPPLELPLIQNWSCHGCGGCCKHHDIEVTAEEKQRIEAQHWTAADGIPAGQPLFARIGRLFGRNRYRLAQQPDGGCVFLDARGLCRIHAKFGEPAKPLACRLYPFALHPAGNKIVVSLRYSCPSVVKNQGKPVSEQRNDLRELERLIVPENLPPIPPPAIAGREQLDWPDTLRVVHQLEQILALPEQPVVFRLLHVLEMVQLLEQAKFDKVRGPRLNELLELLAIAAGEQVPKSLADIPPPSSAGRLQFRMLVAQYSRRDTFLDVKRGWRNRVRLLLSALRFAQGRGPIPRLHTTWPAANFAAIEEPFGPLPPEAEELLTRYLRVKWQGLNFCGAAYYDASIAEGVHGLVLLVTAVLWMARWLAAGEHRTHLLADDVAQALAMADHHHGYNPALGKLPARMRSKLIAFAGDTPRLLAWYAR